MFCLCFLFIFNDFHQTKYLNTCRTDFYQICTRLLELWLQMNCLELVFRFLRDVVLATNVCWLQQLLSTKGFASHSVDGGLRREVQVLRWTQVNQFTEQKIDQSAITSRRLGG